MPSFRITRHSLNDAHSRTPQGTRLAARAIGAKPHSHHLLVGALDILRLTFNLTRLAAARTNLRAALRLRALAARTPPSGGTSYVAQKRRATTTVLAARWA